MILNEEKYFAKELESVKAVLDIRTEELRRLRKQIELMRLEKRAERGEDKETQTGPGACADIAENIQAQRGRSRRILFILIDYN